MQEDKMINLLVPLQKIKEGEIEEYRVSCLIACTTHLSCVEHNCTVCWHPVRRCSVAAHMAMEGEVVRCRFIDGLKDRQKIESAKAEMGR